jgi:hypothetical protein
MARTVHDHIITADHRPSLPDRAVFLSGLVSDSKPWSMRDIATILLRTTGARTPDEVRLRVELQKAGSVGDARFIFDVANAMQPGWGVTHQGAAEVVAHRVRGDLLAGRVKVALERWRARMGGELGAEKLPMVGMNLQGAKLSNRDLTQVDLSHANLKGAVMANAKILLARGACFDGVSADKLVAIGAKLQGASFRGASLRDASFAKANVDGADFAGADLTGSYLTVEGVDLSSVNLRGATVQNMVTSGPVLIKSSWWSPKDNGLIGIPSGFYRVKILGGSILVGIGESRS